MKEKRIYNTQRISQSVSSIHNIYETSYLHPDSRTKTSMRKKYWSQPGRQILQNSSSPRSLVVFFCIRVHLWVPDCYPKRFVPINEDHGRLFTSPIPEHQCLHAFQSQQGGMLLVPFKSGIIRFLETWIHLRTSMSSFTLYCSQQSFCVVPRGYVWINDILWN